jgi:ribosomal-protein-serine acetyltransferase
MYAISLGDDGAELRPLEPWHAEELLAHMERGREFIGRHVALPDAVKDLPSARAFLQAYADKRAADTGHLYGIWLEGKLVGGLLFRIFDTAQQTCEAGCWLEPDTDLSPAGCGPSSTGRSRSAVCTVWSGSRHPRTSRA